MDRLANQQWNLPTERRDRKATGRSPAWMNDRIKGAAESQVDPKLQKKSKWTGYWIACWNSVHQGCRYRHLLAIEKDSQQAGQAVWPYESTARYQHRSLSAGFPFCDGPKTAAIRKCRIGLRKHKWQDRSITKYYVYIYIYTYIWVWI